VTAKLHIDTADLANFDGRDPANEAKVTALIATALQLGGNPATAVIILITAIGTLAERTDNQGCVLAVASSVIDEELGEVAHREASQYCTPDSDSGGAT